MRKYVVVTMLLHIVSTTFCQNLYDAQWIIGYDTTQVQNLGYLSRLDFRTNSLVGPNYFESINSFRMGASNISMCDKEGNLLFYSNGCSVVNAEGNIMENGDVLSPGVVEDFYCPGAMPMSQGVLSLPQPCNDNLYHILNVDLHAGIFSGGGSTLAPLTLYHHIVDISRNNEASAIVEKGNVLIQDTLSRGNIVATMHSNGLDWWIVVPESHSNCYYKMILSEKGISNPEKVCEGHVWNNSDGSQPKFSPNGKYYARLNYQNGLHIMDFDNELGTFSNAIDITFPNDTFPTTVGLSFSASSQFLYASARKRLYQFDMQAEDVDASTVLVAEWDGFIDLYPTIFHISALARDGKIYISSSSSHTRLHVIHEPNKKGLDCNVEQHIIDIQTLNFNSIPNIPYYPASFNTGLCESNSILEPDLTGSNLKVLPNPTSGLVHLNSENEKDIFNIEFYSVNGIQVSSYQHIGNEILDVSLLAKGIYFYKVYQNNEVKSVGKLIVQ